MIDWFTVGAQALNFIILVWLMKRFLYKPILSAIDAREKRIASELADAAAKQADALKQRDLFQKKSDNFDHQRAALMMKATDDANVERQRLLEDAHKAADALATQRREDLAKESQSLNIEIARRTQQEVFAIARKALSDLASTSLEASMTAAFVQRVRAIDGPAKAMLTMAFKAVSEPSVVRSTFDLPTEQCETIQRAVDETFSDNVRLKFETRADLVSGIELTANGLKVAWSIADYLATAKKKVGELLEQPATAASADAPKPEPALATKDA